MAQHRQEPSTRRLVGHWTGRLVHNQQDYPVVLDISRGRTVLVATLDLPDYCLFGSPTVFSHSAAGARIQSTLIDAVIEGRFDGDRFAGSASLFDGIRPTVQLNRTSSPPCTYMYESLQWPSGDATLAGTLIKPTGGGPHPVVVWTHGSGPDTRQTFYYHGRAHLLAQHGVASLIYDKRGAGDSTGGDSWKFENLVADADAAVNLLINRSDIDHNHIGVAGYSQGGWIAPLVASQNEHVDFIVVGATPGVTGGEQNIYSLQTRLRSTGYKEEAVEAARNLLNAVYEFYQTGVDRLQVSTALREAGGKTWFQEELFQRLLFLPDGQLPESKHPYWQPFSPDPMAPWRQLRIPVLSMWGELDRNVPVQLSKQRIEAALTEAGNTDFQMIVFPAASHGMWVVRPDTADWDWPRQAPGCQTTLVDWIRDHTSPQAVE